MFDHKDVRIAFCITKCEGSTQSDCDAILKDLEKETYFSNVLKKPNVKVFFVGCVNKHMIDNVIDTQALVNHYKDIHWRREQVIKYIFEANDEGVKLLSLPIVGASLMTMANIFIAQNDILSKFESTTDFKTGPTQNLVQVFNDNIEYMMKNEGLFTDQELHQKFVAMKQRMLPLKSKMDHDIWTSFSMKVVL